MNTCSTLRWRGLSTLLVVSLVALAFAAPSAEAQSAKRPSNLVQLRAISNGTSLGDTFDRIDTDGSSMGAFTVPAGQVFVMTSVTISESGPSLGVSNPAYRILRLYQSGLLRLELKHRDDDLYHLEYPSGLVFEAGSTISAQESLTQSRVTLAGYLAPDV